MPTEVANFILSSALLLLLFFIVLLNQSSRIFDIESAAQYSYIVSDYWIPSSAKLIYSQRYWGGGTEPLSICIAFSLPEQEFSKIEKFPFKRYMGVYKEDAIFPGKGCTELISQQKIVGASHFASYQRQGNDVRGYNLYINKPKNIVMMEFYIYD